MLSQPAVTTPTKIGVGIDTSRYGHYAAFLREDLNAAAGELQFVESAVGYEQLRQRFEQLAVRHANVHFLIRLDAAGQYADNLLHFLRGLAAAPDSPRFTISCGDPQRNKNYRAALFGAKKSDPIEARAAARYALTEQPAPSAVLADALRTLRQVAGRLQAVVRQRTRLINQFHHLLALTFPELALVVNDVATGWVLELCHRYPTARHLADASAEQIQQIPYLPHQRIDALLAYAKSSIASLTDDTVAELVRDQVRQLRDCRARQRRLEKTLQDAYPWEAPAHVHAPDEPSGVSRRVETLDAQPQTAGLKHSAVAGSKEVTAVCDASLPPNQLIDFAHVKKQLPIQRVLEHLGLASKLRGSPTQKRCACPIHRADGRGRTFSVNLAQNVFHCFDASCQKKGDVIDLWAALHGMDVRTAALDLVQTFDLEAMP